jgi:serine/threonine protein kinase
MSKPESERDPLEVLASEFMERQRLGESPSVEEYAERYPELADDIRDLFPAIAATERLKARRDRTSGGRVSLGAVRLERLGDFRIVREIGRGGMGIVYEAEQESLGRRVAIKVLPRQALLDEKHLRRFRREARVAAGLHHTNIVEVFGVGEQDGFHYFVMQHIDGVGLDAIIRRLAAERDSADGGDGGRTPASPELAEEVSSPFRTPRGAIHWRRVAVVGRQVAEALHYAHSKGTLHRDIKPGNLLVDAQGRAWVTDFGLAKAVRSEDVTATGEIAGTLRYMAPEQLDGRADERSDVYGLGLTLYELLTLQPAFGEADRSSLIHHITRGQPTPPRKLNPDVPRDLETIILKATARDPKHRYASAEALAADLANVLEDRPICARRASSVERAWRWCRRNKALAALAGLAVLLVFLVAVVATVGYVSTRDALREAKTSARLATEALDRIFERFSPQPDGAPQELAVDDAEGAAIDVPVEPVVSREGAALLEDMLPFYERLAQQMPHEAGLRRKVADASRRVGDIRQRLGQYALALEAYQRAIQIYEALDPPTGRSTAARVELAKTYNELGRLHHVLRQRQDAAAAHQQALAVLKNSGEGVAPEPDRQCELARTHYLLAIEARRGPFRRGRPRHRPSHRDRGKRPKPRPHDPDAPPEEAASKSQPRRPGFPRDDDRPSESTAHLDTALTLLEELTAADPGNPRYRHLLGVCYRERFRELAWREPDAARAALEKSTEVLEELTTEYPGVADYLLDLGETYAAWAPHHPRHHAPVSADAAEERLRKALAIASRLAEQSPYIPQYARLEVRVGHQLASLLERAGRLSDEEQVYRKALARQQDVVARFPDGLSHKMRLAWARDALARVLLRLERPAEARDLLVETTSTLEELVAEDGERWFLHALLARNYGTLEKTLNDLGDASAASDAKARADEHRQAFHAHRRARPFGGRPPSRR